MFRARWTGAGIAVDMAKCYDSIRLPLLRRMLTAAGWPSGLSGPLLAAYAFRRRWETPPVPSASPGLASLPDAHWLSPL